VLLAASGERPTLFIGDGAEIHRELIEASGRGPLASPATPLLAGAIGRLAGTAAAAGVMPPPHAIRPLYVRRTDAELAREARGTA
jgi:hypothetical protein